MQNKRPKKMLPKGIQKKYTGQRQNGGKTKTELENNFSKNVHDLSTKLNSIWFFRFTTKHVFECN